MANYPSDDVRYVPTLDEQLERTQEALLDQVRTLYRDYLGADHGELVVVGDFEPSEILPILAQDARGLEGREAVRADRTALPARSQARDGNDRDPR